MAQMHDIKTLVWKQVGSLSLYADIFVPPNTKSAEKRPIAVIFHGGGHVLFSRKRVNPKHIAILQDYGFLPVSFDYRLCPEIGLLDGPMNDACEALRWARFELPSLAPTLAPGLEADGGKVAAVGWSSGGHLSLTLGFTAPQRELKAPEAILAFYCPTDYESEFYKHTIHVPYSPTDEPYDVLEGYQKEPIASYYPPGPPGTFTLEDTRTRFILHMNWQRQTVSFLLRGPSYNPSDTTTYPTKAEIEPISPHAQIISGAFRTPTFLLHGDADKLVPCPDAVRTVEALKERGIKAEIEVVEGAGHLFDTVPQPAGVVFEPSVARAFAWLRDVVFGS